MDEDMTKRYSLYNPQRIDCDCKIQSWLDYHEGDLESFIDTHFYGHIMELFISQVCCDIVKHYVGELPCSRRYPIGCLNPVR
jgi:hypothetical protein